MDSMKSSRAISHVRCLYWTDVSRTTRSLMMMTEMVLETSVEYRHLRWPMVREVFIEFSRDGTKDHIFKYGLCSIKRISKVLWLCSWQMRLLQAVDAYATILTLHSYDFSYLFVLSDLLSICFKCKRFEVFTAVKMRVLLGCDAV